MLRINFYSLLYTTFFTLCSGFVLLSSAAGPNSYLKLFTLGESLVYQWKSTVLLNEIDNFSKNVGFALDGKVIVSSVWGNGEKRLFKLELEVPQLHVKSRKAPIHNGFISHSSNLDTFTNKPFLLVWDKGIINNIYLSKKEPVALKNIKRGIASLFQFSGIDREVIERDASGKCNVVYSSTTQNEFLKTKSHCSLEDSKTLNHTDIILGITTNSTRNSKFLIDDSEKYFKFISAEESHKISVPAKEELGGTISSEQVVTYERTKQCNSLRSDNLEEAINEVLQSEQLVLVDESLIIEEETINEENEKKFSKEVNLLRENLSAELLGSLKPARAFLNLLQVARASSADDIFKTLSSKKNVNILPQLYDILGYTQTKNSHQAVMKKVHLDNEEHADFIERYLWALSFSVHPNVDILEDLLNKYKKYSNIPENVKNTLILSLASMARTLMRSKRHDYQTSKVLRTFEETIINGLDYAKDEERYVFFNALKNLQFPSTIPNLMTFIKNGTLKEELLAWRVLKSFGRSFWTEDLLKLAEKTVYQLDKKHDTSSRAIAVDILLGAGVDDEKLTNLLYFISGNDTNYEIKQYIFQNIRMLSELNPEFNFKVQTIIKSNKKLNNYCSLSPRGLSTALRRTMFNSLSSNGSLVSIQEIKSGIVKRGAVDVIVDKNGLSKELFTLGIFSGGLTSFMSSGNDDDEDLDETATAGMELTVMGTQIRPFVFFEGQGELMGHVWSGTASEMTPAFQALILLQDHEEKIRLGNGFIADVNFKGAIAFDLSGKIQISLWNRNAESLIEKSVGLINSGLIRIRTEFVRSKVEFEASMEPKLSLEIDADFSSNVKLCMRLSQPDSILRHYVSKLERIPGSKHQIKITRNRTTNIPGITYALNRKNNEMCSAIFS